MIETKDLNMLEEYQARIQRLLDEIDYYDIPRTNFAIILSDENLLRAYHKNYGRVSKSVEYVTKLRKQFLLEYQSNPQLAVENMKKRLSILVNLTNLFGPGGILRLRRLLVMLNRTEIDEISKCMADVERWTSFALRNIDQPHRIDFFFNRLVVYIRGGFLDGVQFLGLFSYFRDAELTKELLNNEAVKRLRMYKEQMAFFRKAMYVTLEALREGGNEELFWGKKGKKKDGFYYNLRNGEKYIEKVEKKYENERFARLLRGLDERIHQFPEAWEREFEMLSRELNNTHYQNKAVIEPAIQALLALFQRAKDRITTRKIEIKEVDSLLQKLEQDLEKVRNKVRKDIEKSSKAFDELDNEVASELSKVMPAIIDLSYRLNVAPQRRLGLFGKSSQLYEKWLTAYKAKVTRAFTKSQSTGGAFFAAAKVDDIALMRSEYLFAPLVGATDESKTTQLELRVRTSLIPKLKRVLKFIIENEPQFNLTSLGLRISESKVLLPEVLKILEQLQSELSAEFKAQFGFEPTTIGFG